MKDGRSLTKKRKKLITQYKKNTIKMSLKEKTKNKSLDYKMKQRLTLEQCTE